MQLRRHKPRIDSRQGHGALPHAHVDIEYEGSARLDMDILTPRHTT